MKRWHRWVRWGAWFCAALVLAAPVLYQRLYPVPTRFASELEHFEFGSIGVEAAQGVPYEVWRTLPGLCLPPQERDTGYAKFGFQWESGHPTPVGMPLET